MNRWSLENDPEYALLQLIMRDEALRQGTGDSFTILLLKLMMEFKRWEHDK